MTPEKHALLMHLWRQDLARMGLGTYQAPPRNLPLASSACGPRDRTILVGRICQRLRERGFFWDDIAECLAMKRPTLIYAWHCARRTRGRGEVYERAAP